MGEDNSVVYKLRRFDNSKDIEFISGLNIYSKNIESSIRTNSSEIIYWLDNYNNEFPDSFFVFGFYRNKTIIGFSQSVYFKDEGLLVVDYMVIEKQFRGTNTFYEFVNQIRLYFINYELNFVVTEVVYNNDDIEPSEKSKNLIRLLKIAHFKVAKGPYFQPMLGVNNFESEMRAVLMIYYTGEHNKIKKETFLMIVNTIYYKHYLRWYDHFLTEHNKATYINGLSHLCDKLHDEIKNKSFIELNGHHNLPSEPVPIAKKPLNKFLIGLIVLVLFVSLFSGLLLLYIFLKSQLNVELDVQIAILVATTVCCLIFLAYINRKEDNFFGKMLEKIIDKIKL